MWSPPDGPVKKPVYFRIEDQFGTPHPEEQGLFVSNLRIESSFAQNVDFAPIMGETRGGRELS